MFKTTKVRRISQDIIQQVRNAILSGELRPGDKLPSEKDLAEKFGVSKASLREAFRALEALGLLEVRQGMSGGAFVREVDLETARNNLFNYIFFQNPTIREFTQLRLILEPEVARLAATNLNMEDLVDLENNLRKTEEKLDDGPFYYELDTYFHHRIAAITGNRLICLVIDSIKNAVVNIKLELELQPGFPQLVFNAHVRIFEALSARDGDRAAKEMIRHIQEVEKVLEASCDADSPFEVAKVG